MRSRRSISYVVMALAVAVALTVGTVDRGEARSAEEREQDIADTLRCPACAGQAVGSSDASSAQAIRREIVERIDQGQSDDEIRDYFASRYGESILLTPPSSGVGSLVWIIPVAAFVGGGAGLWFAFRRWKVWDG